MVKRIIGKTLWLVAIVCAMTACSKDDPNRVDYDIIWDIVPFRITMDVNGHDLSGGNVVTAIWRGQTYVLNAESLNTRAIPSVFQGLYVDNDNKLVFGDLSSTAKYEDEQLVIDWGDQTKADTIVFNHELYWMAGLPEFNQRFQLNGKPATLPIAIGGNQ